MIDVRAKVRGVEELQDTLDKKAKQAVKNYIRRAAKAAAKIWVDAIVANAPRATGFLAEHVVVVTKYLDSSTRLELSVGPAREAFYALFLEFGTEFQQAQPFLRPAFEEHKEEVMQAFAEAMHVSLEEMRM